MSGCDFYDLCSKETSRCLVHWYFIENYVYMTHHFYGISIIIVAAHVFYSNIIIFERHVLDIKKHTI